MRGVVLFEDKDMKHKFLRGFDLEGKWTKPTRIIRISGVEHDLDEYAKEHGIELPDAKSKKHKDIKKEVNTNADMGKQDHHRDHQIDGDGDSESSE
jgi:hypothetical protein